MKVSAKLFLATIALASIASYSKDPRYLQNQSENKSSLQTREGLRPDLKPEAIVFKAAGDTSIAVSEFRVPGTNMNAKNL
jgi:uncharacterized lipoprotein